MILYISITLIAILLASRIQPLYSDVSQTEMKYRNAKGRMPEPMTGGKKNRQMVINDISLCTLILFLALFCVLRIHTGNDYQTYISHFHDIFYGNYVVTEKGFNWIVKLIYWFFDEENYLWVFGVFGTLTTIFFVKALYEQSCDFQMSFFLYMTLGIYFQSFNTVRYYFVLGIVLYSMRYVIHDEYMKFALCILIASLFHKSALICLPLFLLARIPWKKWMVGVLCCFSLTGLFFEEFYLNIFLRLYPSYVNEEEYLLNSGTSIVNIVRCLAVLVFSVYFYYRFGGFKDKALWFYFYLNLGALLLYTCFSFIPFVSRIGYYLNISHLLFLPALLKLMPQGKVRTLFKSIILIAAMLYFMIFLERATAINVRILPYSSWLYEDIRMVPIMHH